MSKQLFSRVDMGGVSVSRMIIGTNWLNGYSHRSDAADKKIVAYNELDRRNAAETLRVFLDAGVDTVLGGITPFMIDAIHQAEDMTGKKLLIINTPRFDAADTAEGLKSAEQALDDDVKMGATFSWPFHDMVESMVRKGTRSIDRLPVYLKMIRERGMIPGLSLHMPEAMCYADEQGYDVEGYIQIYNCMGFLMQLEAETVAQNIWSAKKPVLTIKPMAAGRTTPFVGLNFVWNTVRPCDLVCVGCMTPDEAREVIEISEAAIERRPARINKRGSLAHAK